MRRLWVVCGVAFGYLGAASVALAQEPSEQGYGGAGGAPQAEVAGEAGAGAGALPFTGFDILFLLGGAVLLIAAGLMLRRLARARA